MITSTLFRTSINVNYDIGEKEFFKNYLPTPSHAESIIGISKGFYEENASSAHIMIGPYGSGKSLLATVMASFISNRVEQDVINLLINKFKNVHQDVYDSLIELNNVKKVYVPVILSGSFPNFGETLIESIEKSLEYEGIEINLPTERNNIITTVENWKNYFPETYDRFNQLLVERSITIEDWEQKIINGIKIEIDWFKVIYPKLTSGATFNGKVNGDVIKNLEYITEIIREQNIGLFVIHDEFGRFLQNLEVDQIYKTMQDLQDIAEFSNRSDQLLQLLLISHKGMSQYMLGLAESYQSEFQRIEKRYSTYFVESDTATFYRIVHKYLENYRSIDNLTYNLIMENTNKLRVFDLFQNLNQHEVENLVVKGCFPIHPITLFLLPRISRVFGQNERTLFTYLESPHTYGFQNQLKSNAGKYIFPDSLFHYFFTDDVLHEIHDETIKGIIGTYHVINSSLDARKVNAHRIIRFITMWEITNSNNIYKIDSNLIEFATGIKVDRLNDLLEELTKLKFIRYNRIQEKWELSEGSSVVIEELVHSKRIKNKIDTSMRIEEITSLLENKYYLARKYNDEKNITRFMRVKLIAEEDLLNNNVSNINLLEKKSDGVIYYILINTYQNIDRVVKTIKGLNHPQLVFGLLNLNANEIYEVVDDILSIKDLLSDRKLLLDSKNLKEELNLLLKDKQYDLEKFLKHFTEFDKNVDWFYEGKKIILNSQLDLENKISEIMNYIYDLTPRIMNDSVNRFNVTGIQKRSLYKVVNCILNNPYEDNIGIEGQGPDYLIYVTVIKNQGISFRNLDNIENKIFLYIRENLLDHLKNNNEGTVIDLYNILFKSPYGIRPPLIPLILISLIRDKWDQLMFYRNEIFVPALEGEKIYEMFKEPEHYQYVFHNFEDSVINFMNEVERDVSVHISENVLDETQLIRVSSGLLNWLRSLPRQVQITEKHNETLLSLKTIIRRSEINPIQSLEDLMDLFGKDFGKMKNSMNKLESSYEVFKEQVLDDILTLFKKDNLIKLKEFLMTIDQQVVRRNRLLAVLNKEIDIENIAINYVGTRLDEWSDVNYELFIKQIQEDYNLINKTKADKNQNQVDLFIEDAYKPIKKVELSNRGELILTNVNRIIQNAGRSLPKEEIEYVIYKLIKKYIE